MAIGVSSAGCREIIGAAEGMKEDRESWRSLFVWLKERGLTGVRLIIGDKNLGMLETIPKVFSDAYYHYRKHQKADYYTQKENVREQIMNIYHSHDGVDGYRSMTVYLEHKGYSYSQTTIHKYMNTELGMKSMKIFANDYLTVTTVTHSGINSGWVSSQKGDKQP